MAIKVAFNWGSGVFNSLPTGVDVRIRRGEIFAKRLRLPTPSTPDPLRPNDSKASGELNAAGSLMKRLRTAGRYLF